MSPHSPHSSARPEVSTTDPATACLTQEVLVSLREGLRLGPSDLARQNAVTNNDIESLALNRRAMRGDDGHFSHRVKSRGITNQKNTGRCWIFAGLNTLRPQVIRDHRMEEFEFSISYLQFWDKLERANLFLESIIELRDCDFLDRTWEMVNKDILVDGGWWNYLVELVEKYGVVPAQAMPETHASTHTETLNQVLDRMLRARAVRILDRHAEGASVDDMRSEKDEALKDVYRLLVISFGEPPTEFDWRYKLDDKADARASDPAADMQTAEEEKLTPSERHTPHSFYQSFVGHSLADFVCLYNDPANQLDRHYSFDRSRNIVGTECMHFVNIDMAQMKKIAIASVLANEPLWFAVNMLFDQSKEHGVMEHRLFDYETLFGIDLAVSKANRTAFHSGASNHAMALMGVDLDSEGRPKKWLAENSWGDDKGDKGRWTLHDHWFDEHVYTIIVHKRHVPAKILQRFDEEATVLPAWYPGASGISNSR